MMLSYYASVVCVVVAVVVPVTDAWWRDALYYRLRVDSFKDSDGDGLGDIRGATKQLSYVRALGADAVILSALSMKSNDCTKPGVVHHTDIDHRYGTLADFIGFIDKANELGIKVLLELPLQTVSTASEWFVESDKASPEFGRFILRRDDEPSEATPGVDAWLPNDRGTSRYAVRDDEAVLDLCHEGVKAAFGTIQCAWLRRGVAGFSLRPDHETEPACAGRMVRHLTAAAAQCARAAALDTPVVVVESALKSEDASQYYSDGADSILGDVLPSRESAARTALRIRAHVLYAPYESRPTWVTSRLATGRITTRFGSDSVDMINLMTLVSPGAAVIEQGDELGAADGSPEPTASHECRPSRALPASAPFPWDDSPTAGFSAGDPWTPIAPNYRYANAEVQFSSETSHAGVVRLAAAMRKSPAFGPHCEMTRLEDAIAILRWGDSGSLLLVANVGERATEVHPSRIPGLASEMSVATSSAGSKYAAGVHVSTERGMNLNPGECVLLAGGPRRCGGPGPVDKIATKLAEGWHKINKYFGT